MTDHHHNMHGSQVFFGDSITVATGQWQGLRAFVEALKTRLRREKS